MLQIQDCNFVPITFFRENFGCSFTDRGDRSRGGQGCSGRFANFQCQIYLKYGHIANIYRRDSSYQPHESLILHDPTTNQPLQFSTTQFNPTSKSNTQINPATGHICSTPAADMTVH